MLEFVIWKLKNSSWRIIMCILWHISEEIYYFCILHTSHTNGIQINICCFLLSLGGFIGSAAVFLDNNTVFSFLSDPCIILCTHTLTNLDTCSAPSKVYIQDSNMCQSLGKYSACAQSTHTHNIVVFCVLWMICFCTGSYMEDIVS